MRSAPTTLSTLLSGLAVGLAAAQSALDRAADQTPAPGSPAPLAFILQRTQLTLVGTLSLAGERASEPELALAQVSRVEAALGRSHAAAQGRLSIAIEAMRPGNGS